MKMTKYEHACIVVEDSDQTLVVDPGGWTTDFTVPDAVVAVIITHEHQDHLNKDLLKQICDKNPDALVLAHKDVTAQLEDFKTQKVVPNEGIRIGNFHIEFFGGEHANIKKDWQAPANLGVLINETLYYPGDSFTVPEDRHIAALAVPVSAPWLKFNETADFVTAVKADFAFPTHDAILSDAGKELVDRMVSGIAKDVGTEYRRLIEPLEM